MRHLPVLLEESLAFLAVRSKGIYVDGTAGGGGHAQEIAKRLDPAYGKLIAIDLDPNALEIARERLKKFTNCAEFFQGNYIDLDKFLKRLQIEKVDGILLDLGFSSLQIDDPSRGFSFQVDAPLDMRYSPDGALTARDIVNTFSNENLIKIFRDYGEERFAARIAAEIMRSRSQKPIETTGELLKIIERAIPQPAQRESHKAGKSHPATRTFQALRIAVNDELSNIQAGLEAAFYALRPDGRLVVISFHSLEDRIVKQFMRARAQGCTCPPDLPLCVCHKRPEAELLGEATPTAKELQENPRARSARVRALRKL